MLGNLKLTCLNAATQTSQTAAELLKNDHLYLFNGFISCASTRQLLSEINLLPNLDQSEDRKSANTDGVLFHVMTLLCQLSRDTRVPFLVLRTLKFCFQKCNSDPALLAAVRDMDELFVGALRVVYSCIDNPIDGVDDCVLDIFKLVLMTWRKCHTGDDISSTDDNSELRHIEQTTGSNLIDSVHKQVAEIPWHTKGKFVLYAALVEYLNTDQVG